MPRRQARTKMPKRKASKSKSSKAQRKAQRKVTKKKPVRRKSSGKKQNPWLKHVNAVLKELKKENPKASLRDAIPIAKESYNKAQSADSWNVSTSKYSTVSMPKKKSKKKSNTLSDSLIGSLESENILINNLFFYKI